MLIRVCFIKIHLKLTIWKLIAWFKLSIVFRSFLYCIICQMDQFVVQIMYWVLSAWCSQIAFFVKIGFEIPIDWSHQSIRSYIKLPSVDQKWIVNVLLNNTGSLSIMCWIKYNFFDLIEFSCNLYTLTSICVFSWFDYPYVFRCCLRLIICWFIILLFFAWTILWRRVCFIFFVCTILSIESLLF